MMRIEGHLDRPIYDFDSKQPKVVLTWVFYKVDMILYVRARTSFTVKENKTKGLVDNLWMWRSLVSTKERIYM